MPTAVHESVQFCFTSALSVAESSLPFLARCSVVNDKTIRIDKVQYLSILQCSIDLYRFISFVYLLYINYFQLCIGYY
jgi:hypothetical protein